MFSRRVLLGVVLLAGVGGGATWLWADDEAPVEPLARLERELQFRLADRLKTAELAASASEASFQANTITLEPHLNALEELSEAELATAQNVREEIVFLEKHVARVKSLENRIEQLFRIGTRGGETREYYTVKRERESAEIDLLKARIRTGDRQPSDAKRLQYRSRY